MTLTAPPADPWPCPCCDGKPMVMQGDGVGICKYCRGHRPLAERAKAHYEQFARPPAVLGAQP